VAVRWLWRPTAASRLSAGTAAAAGTELRCWRRGLLGLGVLQTRPASYPLFFLLASPSLPMNRPNEPSAKNVTSNRVGVRHTRECSSAR
jgi:hypothetical protein